MSLVESSQGILTCRVSKEVAIGESIAVAIRPEKISVQGEATDGLTNTLRGTVDAVQFMGNLTDCVVRVGEHFVRVQVKPWEAPKKGQSISLHLPAEHCFALPAASSKYRAPPD